MQIRCPHCQNGVELIDESDLQSVDCPSCESQFGIVDMDQANLKTFDSAHDSNTTIGHFDLVSEVGRGVSGSVWQADDSKLAVKVSRPVYSEQPRQYFGLISIIGYI